MRRKMIDPPSTTALHYEIRIRGHLDDRWAEWFDGLTITLEDDGNTLLSGPVVDQAALHGLLKKVRDSGMPLVSVCPLEHGTSTALPLRGLRPRQGLRPLRGPRGTGQADQSDVK